MEILELLIGVFFWEKFRQHSAWQLEAWHPVQEQWVSEFQGENLNSWLTIDKTRSSDNSSEKINLTVTNNAPQATRFRFKFGIDARVKDFVNKTSNFEYVLTYPANSTEDYKVFFNWSDIKPLLENDIVDVKHGIVERQGRDVFYFIIESNVNLGSGNSYTIDPTFGNTDESRNTVSDINDDVYGLYASPSSDFTDNPWDTTFEPFIDLFGNAFYIIPIGFIALALYMKTRSPLISSVWILLSCLLFLIMLVVY